MRNKSPVSLALKPALVASLDAHIAELNEASWAVNISRSSFVAELISQSLAAAAAVKAAATPELE